MKPLITFGLILTIDTFIGIIVTATSMNNTTKDTSTIIQPLPAITNVVHPNATDPTVATMEDNDNLGLDTSTLNPDFDVSPEDIQRTQMIAVVGFSAVVLMAIFAWLFSRHYCCFLEKTPIHPGRHNPSQFNFLGAPARAIRRLSNSTVQPPKREDPPPSYDELFPSADASSVPAPAYSAVDITSIIIHNNSQSSSPPTPSSQESKDPEVSTSSQPA